MEHSPFLVRVVERHMNNACSVRFRENEIELANLGDISRPDLADIRRVFENFAIAVPGFPLILLHSLAAETVATVKNRINERMNGSIER